MFTTNAICKPNYCVNPIFPGVEDLGRLEEGRWSCSSKHKVVPLLTFCEGAVDYNPALPMLNSGTDVKILVKAQERAAITTFAYHLSGMGLEAWDHTKPNEEDDDCIKSVWRMACFTYFPKAELGCKEGQESRYLRPCQSSCGNYIRACAVECCDESVQCVFEHERPVNKTAVIKTHGYASQIGPSEYCTGAAGRQWHLSSWLLPLLAFVQISLQSGATREDDELRTTSRRSAKLMQTFLICTVVLAALTLQGCDMDQELSVPSHSIGNWRREPDYLVKYQFIPPGQSYKNAKVNSCHTEVSMTLQCSGRGVCKAWDPDNLGSPVNFCECSRDWADPECRTPRKSQTYAYILSTTLGWIGADQFYLGWFGRGAMKAVTLGGFGVWWLLDIVRIGAAPVYALEYRVAADLPHWAFVLSLVSLSLLIGFILAAQATLQQRARKRKDAMFMQAEEEAHYHEEMPISKRMHYAAAMTA